MDHQCTEELFLEDVKNHVLEVLRDDGVYRHIRLRRPGTMCMHFDLITWPGYLCYTGDMGTYVFTRLTDMFEFFRTDRAYALHRGKQLAINLSYWSEKLQAVDGNRQHGSAKEFSTEKFKSVINEYRVRWMRARCLETKEQRRELWEAVDDEVLSRQDDGEHLALHAAYDFSYCDRETDRHFHFDDLFEHDFTECKFHFVWCCYALAWGIQQYDDVKTPTEVAV